jgi:hypothetical protein
LIQTVRHRIDAIGAVRLPNLHRQFPRHVLNCRHLEAEQSLDYFGSMAKTQAAQTL